VTRAILLTGGKPKAVQNFEVIAKKSNIA